MKYAEVTCTKFVDETFSKAPVPGGGGVASLVGALGVALGGMVCNLTTGKKKYAQYEEDIQRIMKEAEGLKQTMMGMIDQDAENFLPLSKAYGLPTSTEEEKQYKEETMQAALKELADKGSKLAISDVGCGVLCLKGAMMSGWLNVVINLSSIHDEAYVSQIKDELLPMLEEGQKICDEVYEKVLNILNS